MKNLRQFAFILIALLCSTGQAWAQGGGSKYYAQVTATCTSGEGTVNVSNSTTAGTYSTSSNVKSSSTSTSGGNRTFYLFSKPADGYLLNGWTMTSGSSQSLTAGTSYYTLVVKASTTRGGTQSYTIKANFVKAPTATINVGISSGGPTKGKVFVSASTTQGTSTSVTQYATALATQSKTFYLFAVPDDGYEFVGWAKNNASATTADAGLTTQTAQKVTLSTGSTAGSTASATYYAIFRKKETKATVNVSISSKSGTQDGTVSVSLSSTEAGNLTTLTQTDDSGSPADKTFYLWASPNATATNNHYVFAGWTETASGEDISLNADQPKKVTITTGDNVEKNYYAIFKQLKHFQFSAQVDATLEGVVSTTGGTASVSLDKTDVWATSLSQQSETATATLSATANPGYAFIGWTQTLGKTTPDVDENGNQMQSNPYPRTITNTAGGTSSIHFYAIFSSTNDPTSVTVTPTSINIDKDATQQINLAFTPTACYKNYTFASSNPEVAKVDGNGLVTGMKQGTANITVTIKRYDTTVFKTETIAVTVYETLPEPTITITQDTSDPTKSIATIEKEDGTPDGAVIRYTVNGSDPTETSPIYTEPLTVNALDTIKAIVTCNGWRSSEVVTKIVILRKTKTPNITIKRSQNNLVTLTCSDPDVTIWYTTNGDTPVPNPSAVKERERPISKAASSTQEYTGPFTPDSIHCTIKAVATHAGWMASDVATDEYYHGSQVANGTVFLNDLEDHRWTYYQPNGGVDASYNYPDKLCSPYPRNVKITYYGNGLMYTGADGGSTTAATGVQVSGSENEDNFVYLKTLERDANNRFPYQLIPNPFSKRPTYSSDATTKWRGFHKWRVKSVTGGTIYNASSGGTAQAVGALLDAEGEYYFQPSDNSMTNANNAISMEVELEAVWARAYRVACAVGDINTNISSSTFTGGSYERNFLVVNSGSNSSTTINDASQKPVTIMMVEPDFSSNYRSGKYINPREITANNDLKFEYFNINAQVGDALTGNYWDMKGGSSTMIYANMHNLIMGRGVDNTSAGGIVAYEIVGYNTSAKDQKYNTTGGSFNYHMRIESGNYHFLTPTQNWTFTYYPGLMNIKATYGCDYDRAKGDNEKMKVRRRVYGGNGTGFTSDVNRNHETIVHVMKSGNLGSDLSVGNGDIQISNTDFNASVYFGVIGYHSFNYQKDQPSYTGIRSFYMEGGIVGNLNGGCDTLTGIWNTDEAVRIRMKGGTVRGALYGAATQSQGKGFRRFILTGGTVQGWIAGGADGTAVDFGQTNGASYIYVGGDTQVNSGGSTTVINRAVGGNVFGAGCGYSATSTSGQMHLGTNVVIGDDAYIERGVYGGGSYGFTKSTANIIITGGRIGGNVGGVNGTTYDASIQGGVYGGACQNIGGNANIYMTGGIIERGLYGGSNASGTLSGNTTLHIDGGQIGTASVPANAHGGGYGQTTVVSGNVDISIGTKTGTSNFTYTTAGTAEIYGDVYGGSALGTVNTNTSNHTNVTLNGGTIYGSIYGGALGSSSVAANVNGPVQVKVYGGSVKKTSVLGSGGVYGCNNINGTPKSTVAVDIYGTDPAPSEDEYALYSVYGGGNQSAYTGTPVVTVHNCTNSIEYVYGGGNAADVNGTNVTIWGGDVIGNVFGGGNGSSEGWPEGQTNPGANIKTSGVKVNINGGTILNVFGGSNTLGAITGGINVTVNQQKESNETGCVVCPVLADSVFGGGNKAPYTGDTYVNVLNGIVGNVFGGGKLATVTGNSNVVIGDWVEGHNVRVLGNVFGGGDKAKLTNGANVTVNNCATLIMGDVYGGGNEATSASANTKIYGGTVEGALYGAGRGTKSVGADILGNATTNVYGGNFGGIFGGGNIKSDVTGTAKLWIDEQVAPGQTTNCDFSAEEIYGAGNEAPITGTIDLGIGCFTGRIEEIYGGAKNADYGSSTKPTNIHLVIHGGRYGKIFGGNNLGGTIYGSITIDVTEDGCNPIIIDTLFCCGNQAPYNAAGYSQPTINVNSCTLISRIFGGGLGSKAILTGSPTVNLELKKGKFASQIGDQIGEIGTVFGGGNEAKVIGNTRVNIATKKLTDGTDARITGNVYGGGNNADIQGNTHVQIGPEK